jgi:hypothetical protein
LLISPVEQHDFGSDPLSSIRSLISTKARVWDRWGLIGVLCRLFFTSPLGKNKTYFRKGEQKASLFSLSSAHFAHPPKTSFSIIFRKICMTHLQSELIYFFNSPPANRGQRVGNHLSSDYYCQLIYYDYVS